MAILNGLVLEQAAFHTQIPYNLCCLIAKIVLRSYLEHPSPPTILCVDTFEDYEQISPLQSTYQCWIHPPWHLYLPSW
jgi:hypothetical protein